MERAPQHHVEIGPAAEQCLAAHGVRYNQSFDWRGRPKLVFPDVEPAGPDAFLLAAQDHVLFVTTHHEHGMFKSVHSAETRTPEEFVADTQARYPDAALLVVSCCDPDGARKVLAPWSDKLVCVGDGAANFRTVHNDRARKLTVSAV